MASSGKAAFLLLRLPAYRELPDRVSPSGSLREGLPILEDVWSKLPDPAMPGGLAVRERPL